MFLLPMMQEMTYDGGYYKNPSPKKAENAAAMAFFS